MESSDSCSSELFRQFLLEHAFGRPFSPVALLTQTAAVFLQTCVDRRGDGLVVQMSLHPVPTINKTDHTGDWFSSLDRAFNFNNRPYQKPLEKGDKGDKDG
mmetsp:Transcript_6675/g.20218  ORF Transcript_6675/g.20218 Transcript_6675/m.20218 type:complete len:101 (-) Transcript_6675:375-677(-)